MTPSKRLPRLAGASPGFRRRVRARVGRPPDGPSLALFAALRGLERGLTGLPLPLRFPWRAAWEAKTARPKNRNPSAGTLRIGPVRGNADHARWNLRASGLLGQARSRSRRFSARDDGLRALEAALFMVGHDLGPADRPAAPLGTAWEDGPGGGGRRGTRRAWPSAEPARADGSRRFPLTTRGFGHPFRVDFDARKQALVFSYPPTARRRRHPRRP